MGVGRLQESFDRSSEQFSLSRPFVKAVVDLTETCLAFGFDFQHAKCVELVGVSLKARLRSNNVRAYLILTCSLADNLTIYDLSGITFENG